MSMVQQHPPPGSPIVVPEPPTGQPVYYVSSAPPRQSAISGLLAAVLLSILLLVVGLIVAFFLVIASLAGWGGRAVGDAGDRVAGTVRAATEAAGQAGQDLRDRFDPSHPPRGSLVYDPEIDELLKLGVGQTLPGGRVRAFALAAIKSRADGARPELSHYAVIRSELRQPNETRVLGLTVRKDSEPRDDYLYRGEALRIGGQVYKVNWISPERQQIALVQLRSPDYADLPVKLVYE